MSTLKTPFLPTLDLKPIMEGITYQPPMTLPFYQYSPVPNLEKTWITSILLDPQLMFLKILFSLVNITTSGWTDPQLDSTCRIFFTVLSSYPLYLTQRLEMFPLNFTVSMIINSKLTKGRKSLNNFGKKFKLVEENVEQSELKDLPTKPPDSQHDTILIDAI